VHSNKLAYLLFYIGLYLLNR